MNRALVTALAALLIAGTARAGTFEDRERDWRNGAVVYQIIIDRFVPSARLDAKRALYPAPKTLKSWTETPKPGRYLEDQKLSAHELDSWGGDLASATTQLDPVQQLGADGWRLDTALELTEAAARRLVQALQFTLPGAPNPYYGAEFGMTDGGDPENRGPMRWNLVRDDNPELVRVQKLVGLRKAHRALDTRVVVANPSAQTVRERLLVANPHRMDDTPLVDVPPSRWAATAATSVCLELIQSGLSAGR